VLTTAGIDLVVDVRRYPASRRHPHFTKDAMAIWLTETGVQYQWEERLGGRRRGTPDSPNVGLRDASFRAYADYMETREFLDALHEVLELAESRSVAVMCAESLWWRCHRRLIADHAVLINRAEVSHVFHDDSVKPHAPTPEAHVRDGVLRYEPLEPTLL
jgi:uncharacterized protein (DUF488 family)